MLSSILSTTLTVQTLMYCTLTALGLGLVLAFAHMYKTRYTKSFIVTTALLPAVVSIVILMVNGNLGTGIAVAGAFSLVRFRSAQGNAKEIGTIFCAMATGLACGMGYLSAAAIFVAIIVVFTVLLNMLHFGEHEQDRELKITIPENLDYDGIFDDIFEKYTKKAKLVRVKTTNMGTMYELYYDVILNGDKIQKQFIDELRTRNGNLTITCGQEIQNYQSL